MKVKLALAFAALVIGTLIFRWYGKTGYLHYEWPFPRIIAPAFHLDGESAEDADLLETHFWCVASSAAVLFGLFWIVKRIRIARS
jgi:hypothetical protein